MPREHYARGIDAFVGQRQIEHFERVQPSPILPVEAIRATVRRRDMDRPALRGVGGGLVGRIHGGAG